jgi:uncharacterized membrane protein YoaK (UPF0700 family)
MQYNTFRQAEGIPMATTFVTNHIRQTGIWAVTAIKRGDRAAGSRAWKHFRMIGMFFLGALIPNKRRPVKRASDEAEAA